MVFIFFNRCSKTMQKMHEICRNPIALLGEITSCGAAQRCAVAFVQKKLPGAAKFSHKIACILPDLLQIHTKPCPGGAGLHCAGK
ncbi:MAG: hypothetical protein OGM67_13390 [Oscillospiraceae bacterium]|nr:MAG: hypothetical protein OGM67_13390 [Oscillospiraceae bacterium]